MKHVTVLIVLLAVTGLGCGGGNSNNTPTSPSQPVNVPFSTTDIRVGTGTEATVGRAVQVRYTGWVYSTTAAENKGTQFDSGSFPFTVGSGVIAGFSQGVTGMRVGGLRRVVIPPNLAYGNNPPPGSGIPQNATLIFEIELLAVQ